MPEYFDIYDRHRTRTGRTVLRSAPLADDEYRIVVQVWIQRTDGRWLISKRAACKSQPLKWESTGGCVLSGEDSLQAALREVREELGIALTPEDGILFASFRRNMSSWENPGFLDVWMFPADVRLEDLTLQPEEVCCADWATADEISGLITSGLFVPVEEYAFHGFLPERISPSSVRTSRIRYMESVLDCALSEGDGVIRSKHLAILESYYHSPLWQADYAADEAGLLPPALKRGVLSQDTIYDLLTPDNP